MLHNKIISKIQWYIQTQLGVVADGYRARSRFCPTSLSSLISAAFVSEQQILFQSLGSGSLVVESPEPLRLKSNRPCLGSRVSQHLGIFRALGHAICRFRSTSGIGPGIGIGLVHVLPRQCGVRLRRQFRLRPWHGSVRGSANVTVDSKFFSLPEAVWFK